MGEKNLLTSNDERTLQWVTVRVLGAGRFHSGVAGKDFRTREILGKPKGKTLQIEGKKRERTRTGHHVLA